MGVTGSALRGHEPKKFGNHCRRLKKWTDIAVSHIVELRSRVKSILKGVAGSRYFSIIMMNTC